MEGAARGRVRGATMQVALTRDLPRSPPRIAWLSSKLPWQEALVRGTNLGQNLVLVTIKMGESASVAFTDVMQCGVPL